MIDRSVTNDEMERKGIFSTTKKVTSICRNDEFLLTKFKNARKNTTKRKRSGFFHDVIFFYYITH